MSEAMTIAAQVREKAGKGASRAVRREGRVPAVVYGDGQDPIPVHVEEKALVKLLRTGHMMSSVVMVEVEGGEDHRTLPKDVQFHPVTDRPLHVDFMRLKKGATITVSVPMHFEGREASPGLERGGVLNVVRHEVEIECRPSLIPEELLVSLEGLEIGDSIHISQVPLPEGVSVDWGEHDFTVATIVAPSAIKSEAEEDEDEEEVDPDAVPATEQDGEDGADGGAEGDGDAGDKGGE